MLGYVGINFGSGMYEEEKRKRKGDFSMDREEKEEGKKLGVMCLWVLQFFYFF